MGKRFLLILTALFSVQLSLALPTDTTMHSLLWRVSGKEMKKPSYLFGTIHLICPADYVWTKTMEKALQSTDEVCLEMDMDDPNLMMTIAKGMIDLSGKTLKDYFTEEQYNKLARYLAETQSLDIAMFSQMKPAALQLFIVSKVAECDSPLAYETVIMETAQKRGVEITGLEEPEEQLALLEMMPTDSIAYDLIKSIEQESDDSLMYAQMVAAYKQQDLQALHDFIAHNTTPGDNMADFLDVRNERWIGRIIERMDQRSVFFAVGAGHLPGPNGVINLLRKEGYTVEAVK